MPQETPNSPVALNYATKRRRISLILIPITVAAVHFSVSRYMYWHAYYRINPSTGFLADIPPPTAFDPVFEGALKALMLPLPDLDLPFYTLYQSYYIIAFDSLCWAIAAWYGVRLVRHLRRMR